MDLDNIKKDWQQADSSVSIGEDKIKMMLNNKGKSAFANLLKYEKLFFRLLIICFAISILFWFINIPFAIAYLLLLTLSFLWQKYKIKFLERINLFEMDILEVSQLTNKYKIFINTAVIIEGILAIPLCGLYCYGSFYQRSENLFWITFLSMSFVVIISCILIYKFMFYNNVKYLEQSIKEAKEFEKDNI